MKKTYFISILAIILMQLTFSAHAQHKTGIVAHRGFWNCEEAGYAKNSVAAPHFSTFSTTPTTTTIYIYYYYIL